MKNKLFCFIFLFTSIVLNAQKPVFTDFRIKYGFIFPHHPEIRSLLTKHIFSYNFQIGIKPYWRAEWLKAWNYPQLGAGIYYSNYGNDTLGKVVALYFFTDFEIFRIRNYSFDFITSFGGAYHNRPFNVQNNYMNFVIGSHFNIFADISLEHHFQTDNLLFYFGTSWTHTSNGGTKMPNLGINFLGLNFGTRYYFARPGVRNTGLNTRTKKIDFLILGTFGYSQKRITEPQFLVANIILETGLQYSEKSKVFVGTDITYNKRSEYIERDTGIKAIKIAPSIGYAAVFNKIEFIFKNSYRLKSVKEDFKLYQTYGFRINIWQGLTLNLTLNTHWFNAQYIETGFGYRLYRRQ